MNPRIVRLRKEARSLFWPWCAVVIAGASPIVWLNSYTRKLGLLSFFVGVPLLAALSIGTEFQQRTLALWLTQPASRMRLWGEKMGMAFVAALSAGLVSGIGAFYFTWPQLDFTWRTALIVCVVVAAAAAPAATLVTRSLLGGFGLIAFYLCSVFLLAGKILLADEEPLRSLPAGAIIAICGFGLCSAVLMPWLGARALARFQVIGGSSEVDLVMTGAGVVPGVVAAWFRCRSSGVLGNLVRKELRLLLPYWLFSLLALLGLGLAAMLRLVKEFPITPRQPGWAGEFAAFVTLGAFFLLMPVFAGILSLGEERTSGTQAWQMTLPPSAFRQWFLKLIIAMSAGLLSAVLLPLLVVIAVGAVFGSPSMLVNFRELNDWVILVPVMTFAGFWCACAADGTLRASLWVAMVPSLIVFTRSGGTWLGQELARTTGTLQDVFVSRFHLSPLLFAGITDSARNRLLWLFVPTLLLALIQSYQLFRLQPQHSARWMVRCVAPPIAVTVLWSFSASAGLVSSRWEPFDETRHALDKIQLGTAKLELTGEDLSQSSSLTALTRRWLAGSRITIARDQTRRSGYLATIHLASGAECRLMAVHYGGTSASCGK